ncbi:cytochrome P450 [Punctularia strigosozonata HHB-11173 SS5]|uniref:cytochrome P450 n=1 Tax=Punctularia strigosozonata (strain HHB-11173) TaxID=741275 RepID=UPI0004416307|nr:cytochrome P450 [Punctularia strigosozonata HHB-11173 SS5]EIN05345.1 cytochrome P450 [Punctularia strigosozonata HHB-11173 SS5]
MMNETAWLGVTGFALFGLSKLYRLGVVKSTIKTLPSLPGATLFYGNTQQLWGFEGGKVHEEIGNIGSVVKVYGLAGDEHLYVSDPRALHHILVKDQDGFEESMGLTEATKLFWGKGLIGSVGDDHKKQRKMLNPVFSTANLREIKPVFSQVTKQLREGIAGAVRKGDGVVNILDWLSRAALEYIGIGGLGYSFGALGENPNTVYGHAAENLLPTAAPYFPFLPILPMVTTLLSAKTRRRIVELLPPVGVIKELKWVIDTMAQTAKDIYMAKKRALEDGEGDMKDTLTNGKDILTILMRANMQVSEADRMPEHEVLGQMTTLIFAAYDTTSSSLSRILYLLSKNQTVQDELRAEVLEVHEHHGDADPSYDQLMSLPVLDSVVRETLRLHSPAPFMTRVAKRDNVLPLAMPMPGTDGNAIREVPIRKGQGLYIGIASINRSRAIYGPDAEEWKPARWRSPLPSSVSEAKIPGVYSNQLTFLGGGRACIGFTFAELEIKTVLYMLLCNFKFEPRADTISWKLTPVMIPYIKGRDDDRGQLPLKVSLLKH